MANQGMTLTGLASLTVGLQRRGKYQEVHRCVANIIRMIAQQQTSFNKIPHTTCKLSPVIARFNLRCQHRVPIGQ